MAKVFISYSRKDVEFARKLTNELKNSQMDFWVDWEGIPPTVDWWKEIEKGIEESDAFLFLISPDSSASKVCGQEIDCAVKNAKRIIPLVVREEAGSQTPKQLGHLNWIFFRPQDDFAAAIQKLLSAIHTDYEWVQAHSKLQNKALEWERSGKNLSYLLRGVNLTQAETNLAVNTSTAPHPTDLMREYVFASRKATDRQRGITTGLSIAAGIALALLAVYGFVQADLAKAEARRATAGQLALESKSALEKYPQRALLLALESVQISQDANEPVLTEAEEALRLANERVSGYGLTSFSKEPTVVQFTKDGKWLLAGTQFGGEARLWNVQKMTEDPAYQPFSISFGVNMNDNDSWDVENGLIRFSANETWLIVNATDGESGLWKVDVEDENRAPIHFDGKIEFLTPEDETVILEKLDDAVVLWQVDAIEVSKKEIQRFPGVLLDHSDNGQYLVINNPETGVQLWDLSTNPASLKTTLTEPGFMARFAFFNGDYRWLVLVQNVEHPDILVDNGYQDAENNWVTVMGPWKSNNFLVYSMDDLNAKPSLFEVGAALYENSDSKILLESPNHKRFFYSGQILNANADTSYVTGYMDLSGDTPVNTIFREDISLIAFVGNDFMFMYFWENENAVSEEKFMDLRDMSLVDNPGDDFYLYDKIYTSKDGRYIATSEKMLDIQALEDNREVKISPIRPALFDIPEKAGPSEFANSVKAKPQSFGLEDAVTITATSPDGRWFVAGTYDGSLRLWDQKVPRGDQQITLSNKAGWVQNFSFSNDNQWMVLNEYLIALNEGIPVNTYSLISAKENAAISVFSLDSKWLVTVKLPAEFSETGQVMLTDLSATRKTGKISQEAIKTVGALTGSIQYSADSRWVIFLGKDSFLYDLKLRKAHTIPDAYSQAVFMEDQKHVVLVGLKAEVWTLPDNAGAFAKIGTLATNAETVLFASQNGHWLLSIPTMGGTDPEIQLWDVTCITNNQACEPKSLPGIKAAFSRDSKTLLTGILASDKQPLTYEVWDLKTGTPRKTFSGTTTEPNLLLGNSAKWLIFSKQAAQNGAFLSSTWSDTPKNFITTFDGYGYYYLGGGGGGGGSIGSYQIDYFVQAVDVSGKQPINLRGHESNVSLNLLSPNEAYLLTFSGGLQDDEGAPEYLMRLWDMNAVQENPKKRGVILPYVGTSEADSYSEFISMFSPNSEWIYTLERVGHNELMSEESILHFTPTSIEVLKEQACQKVGRNFIINEWERFFPDDAYRKTCENLPEHPSAIVSP